MTEIELAWLAGILEGEGSFMLENNNSGGKTYQYACITVCMTDKDVIDRVAILFGVSTYSIPNTKFGKKPAFRATLKSHKAVVLMEKLLPFMGDRRSAKIIEVVNAFKAIEPTEIRRARSCSKAQKQRWAMHGTREGKLNDK